MKFYYFDQNNSGGIFHQVDEAGNHDVIIEAPSADIANMIAEKHDVYFDDNFHRDCPCCGQRWSPVSESDGEDLPHRYGEPIDLENPTAKIIYFEV